MLAARHDDDDVKVKIDDTQRNSKCRLFIEKAETINHIISSWLIGLVGREFANGPGDLGSISGHVIPKTLKIVLDTYLLNTQQYKVRIKGKMEQSWERSSALLCTSVLKLLKREPSGRPRLKGDN